MTLDSYDWSPVTLPADITREHLTTLDFALNDSGVRF